MVEFVHSRLQFKGAFMLTTCIPLELQLGVKHLAVIIDERYGLHIQRSNDYLGGGYICTYRHERLLRKKLAALNVNFLNGFNSTTMSQELYDKIRQALRDQVRHILPGHWDIYTPDGERKLNIDDP